MENKVYLEYLDEFECYGIKKSILEKMKEDGIVPDIRFPEEVSSYTYPNQPTVGFLLGQDKGKDGTEYYSIGENYTKTIVKTGANIKFLDYEQPYAEMKDCHGLILPGGIFDNPEEFYIDGKKLGINAGKRYFAYQASIEEAHKHNKPMLGICAGAQMIGTILGNMKMYRDLKTEIPVHAVHKPRAETDVKKHEIHLKQDTWAHKIMDIDPTTEIVQINSRHIQGMVHPALQDYVEGTPRVKMDLYAVSNSDGIPEMWGNEKLGIFCVQGHPEDLAAAGDKKMQNIYTYVVKLARAYQLEQNNKVVHKLIGQLKQPQK